MCLLRAGVQELGEEGRGPLPHLATDLAVIITQGTHGTHTPVYVLYRTTTVIYRAVHGWLYSPWPPHRPAEPPGGHVVALGVQRLRREEEAAQLQEVGRREGL